jgi:hypothetical protein
MFHRNLSFPQESDFLQVPLQTVMDSVAVIEDPEDPRLKFLVGISMEVMVVQFPRRFVQAGRVEASPRSFSPGPGLQIAVNCLNNHHFLHT